MKEKKLEFFRTNGALRDANGPIWMPQALKPLFLIQFWCLQNGPFPLLALWGNKKWPQYENEKFGKVSEQMGLKGMQMVQIECPRQCWSPSISSSFEVCKMAPFHYWLFGVIRNGPLHESKNKRGLKRCKWCSLNAAVTETSLSHQVFLFFPLRGILFLIFFFGY